MLYLVDANSFIDAKDLYYVIDRVPGLANKGGHVKQYIRDKLLEHKAHICKYGDDMAEIKSWRWGQSGR